MGGGVGKKVVESVNIQILKDGEFCLKYKWKQSK